MRVGVAGYGYWGQKHARVLSSIPGITLTVFDERADLRAQAQREHPEARVEADMSCRLYALDAVVIATPPASHAELANEALTAGCHVLVEKPMATSTAECRQMIETAFMAGRTLMVGHTYDYHGIVDELHRTASREHLGDLRHIRSVRTNVGMHRRDVSVLWDLAPHDVAIINRLAGGPPSSVSAWIGDHTDRGVADHALMQLRYGPQNVTATIEVSWLRPRKVRELTVVGSRATAVYDEVDAVRPLRTHRIDSHHRPEAFPAISLDAEPTLQDAQGAPMAEPLVAELTHFLRCVRTGSRPRSDGPAGLDVVSVLEAAEQSAISGSPVELSATQSAVPSISGGVAHR
jgi:predicted dehydrogenase